MPYKDYKRRTTQSILEALRISHKTEDSDFEAAYAEYKGLIASLRQLQASMRAQSVATKKFFQTQSALSVELAAFNRGTVSADGAMALGQVHADLERIQFAACDRLFEEAVVSETEMLQWQVPEVTERVKVRKNLLLDYNSHMRRYEATRVALAEVQNSHGSRRTSILRRPKNEQDLSAELATRKVKLEHAETSVQEVTEWCYDQFDSLLNKREEGNILSGQMAAILACQLRLTSAGAQRLLRIQQYLPLSEKYTETLTVYEREFASLSGNSVFPDPNPLRPAGQAVFRAPLPNNCSIVIQEGITTLENIGGLETEDIFRAGANRDVVEDVRERYNAGETGVFEELRCDPHDIVAVIKRYLQELPEALIPDAFYNRVIDAARANDDCDSLARVIEDMPDSHLRNLFPLLKLLHRIARRSDVNKMNFHALAVCLAPTIIRPPKDEAPAKWQSDMQYTITALKTLIEHAKRFNMEDAHEGMSSHINENYAPMQNLPPLGRHTSSKHTSIRPEPRGADNRQSVRQGSMFSRMSMRRGSNSSSSMSPSVF